MAEMVKNLPAMQETQVRSLGREYPLEKGMATHCGILAWRIPWSQACARTAANEAQLLPVGMLRVWGKNGCMDNRGPGDGCEEGMC